MDSNTSIGIVDKYLITLTDGLSNDTINVSKSFTVNPDATYGQVDEASRAVVALSRETYQDTILVTNISVNEIIAGS